MVGCFSLIIFGSSPNTTAQPFSEADLTRLPTIPPSSVPAWGTFWLIKGASAPLPTPPWELGDLLVYDLGDAQYLVDDRSVDYDQLQLLQDAEAALTRGDLREGPGLPDSLESNLYADEDLWLELSAVTDGIASLVVHPPALGLPDGCYDLFWTTNLVATGAGLNLTNWAWVLRTTRGQTNFTLSVAQFGEGYFRLGRTNDTDADGLSDAFEQIVSHSDPGNWDSDGDDLPDGWEWLHFATFAEGPSGDYDNDAATNWAEFNAGTDPNTINFTTTWPSLRVSQQSISGLCQVTTGQPYEMAVVCEGGSTNWVPYSAAFSVVLGEAEGLHTIAVGLRGHHPATEPIWDLTEIALDRTPPVVLITNPATGTVNKPVIQLLGWADEPLAVLSYSLTNSAGYVVDEPAYVIDQHFDTNLFDFTTNWFQAYDVEVCEGVNFICLSATDLAGNTVRTNLQFSVDYHAGATAPGLQVAWPANNASVSGDRFYIRGRTDNETAKVLARWVDDAGVTNEVQALVERNGVFWIENLPLAEGTNLFAVVGEDAAGNLSGTNLSIVKSSVALEISSTPEGSALYLPTGTVSGTVTDPNCTVTVNGQAAVADASGYWTAENVPINGTGTATFDVVARAGGQVIGAASLQKEMPAEIVVTEHFTRKSQASVVAQTGATSSYERYKKFKAAHDVNQGATALYGKVVDFGTGGDFWWRKTYEWTATSRGTHYIDSDAFEWSSQEINESFGQVTGIPDKDLSIPAPGGGLPEFVHHYYAANVRPAPWFAGGATTRAGVIARTKMVLYTGGKAGIKRKSLFKLTASARQYGRPPLAPWLGTPDTHVDATRIQLFGCWLFGRQYPDPEGDVYLTLPDNAAKSLNLQVPGVKHYGAWAKVQKVNLEVRAVTFAGHTNILVDGTSTAYPPPHWQTNEESGTVISQPVLYVSGSRVQTSSRFKLGGGGSFPVIIRGKVSGGGTSFMLWGTNNAPHLEWCATPTIADVPLEPNRVDCYKPMTIRWQYSHTNKLEFIDAGVSTNWVYVSLREPTNEVPLYHTVVHLACAKPGATSDSEAVANTWSFFEGPGNVKTWDNKKLYYWAGGASQETCTRELLHTRNGQCGAWAEILIDAWRANGVSTATKIYLTPLYKNDQDSSDEDKRGTMLVRRWSFQIGSLPPEFLPFTHDLLSELVDETGSPGQNNPNPPGAFRNHFIVGFDGSYFDPSYGQGPYPSLAIWEQSSIDGYSKIFVCDSEELHAVKQNSSGFEMDPPIILKLTYD